MRIVPVHSQEINITYSPGIPFSQDTVWNPFPLISCDEADHFAMFVGGDVEVFWVSCVQPFSVIHSRFASKEAYFTDSR